MLDKFGREINYIRISITDHCNFSCKYCNRSGGFFKVPKEDILSYEDIATIAKAGLELGIKKIRLTGGEPLARQPIVPLIRMLKDVGVPHIAMTTNGSLLKFFAEDMAKAGLSSINVSLDTTNPKLFSEVAGVPSENLWHVLEGIDAAIQSGIKVKLNTVVMKDITTKSLPRLLEFARKRNIPIRFIELMPKTSDRDWMELFYPISKFKEDVEKLVGPLTPINEKLGDGPSLYWQTPDGVIIGFIAFFSLNYCSRCNRIRVDSRGNFYPCLFSHIKIEGLYRIRQGVEETKELLKEVIFSKPKAGNPKEHGVDMQTIGG